MMPKQQLAMMQFMETTGPELLPTKDTPAAERAAFINGAVYASIMGDLIDLSGLHLLANVMATEVMFAALQQRIAEGQVTGPIFTNGDHRKGAKLIADLRDRLDPSNSERRVLMISALKSIDAAQRDLAPDQLNNKTSQETFTLEEILGELTKTEDSADQQTPKGFWE